MFIDWKVRLRSLFRRRRVEQDLDDELAFHRDQQIDAYVRAGMERSYATRRARPEMGGLDRIKEDHRDARGVRLLEDLLRDFGYAGRQLRRSPGFAVLAVVCLGLGIGVNTAIFGVLNAVLLRSLPVQDPDSLAMLTRGAETTFSYPVFRDYQTRSRSFASLAASLPMESDLEIDGESEFVTAEVVSAGYATVFGVRPVLGQWFATETEPVAVISHAVWQRRFGGRPDVLGRLIRSESQSYSILGVAPREFIGVFAPFRTDIWVPLKSST